MRRTRFFTNASFVLAVRFTLTLTASLAAAFSGTAAVVPPGGLAVTQSNTDLILSFPTTALRLYTVQSSPDLVQPWTKLQTEIPGDGTPKTMILSNATFGRQGFFRLLIQTPTGLTLPQAQAFAVLGHSCGGIKEQVYVTGFDTSTGNPMGEVYLSTTCSTGGRGSIPATFTAWAAVTWDFAGNVISSGALLNAAAVNSAFIATDSYGDTIYNANSAAYLVVPIPAAPSGVTAVQSGDQFQVSWNLNGVNPAAIVSSTVKATPVNSAASILTTTVTGPTTAASIPTLQPDTTYQITVTDTTLAGSSSVSTPITLTTSVASIPASAPTGIGAHWLVANPSGTTDVLVASWLAADPGNSPVDEYQITIIGSDGAGTFTQTVAGTELTASFTIDYIPNWSVTVKAHNAVGWGPSSAPVTLGGL